MVEQLPRNQQATGSSPVIGSSYLNYKRSETSRQEHIDLIDCILNGEKEKAMEILYRHLDRVQIAKDAAIKKKA